jgi:putative ABC transport system permease protein
MAPRALGANLLYVQNGAANFGSPASQGAGSATTLTFDDAQAVAVACSAVKAVAPSLIARAQVTLAEANTKLARYIALGLHVKSRAFLDMH